MFDIDRENKTIIPFGSGPHICLGMHLAKLEVKIGLEEFFKTFKSYSMHNMNVQEVKYRESSHVRGPESIPLSVKY